VNFAPAAVAPYADPKAHCTVNAQGAVSDVTITDPGDCDPALAAPNVNIGAPPAVDGAIQATALAAIGTLADLNFDWRWKLGFKPYFVAGGRSDRIFQVVAAYGYAYEGHCYRFDQPRLLTFESKKGDNGEKLNIGCGFDPAYLVNNDAPPNWYRMFRLKSAQRIIELSAAVNDIQTLILDANLPGKRSPSTYTAMTQVAHRSGRLMHT
jgi:hypothetical protein